MKDPNKSEARRLEIRGGDNIMRVEVGDGINK